VEVSLPSTGLGRALTGAALAFLGALAVGSLAASLAGHLLARRITRPLDALRAGAAAVAGGDLSARVDAEAQGEVGELVRAFNAMTADLGRVAARAAAAERVAAWREVARRLAHEVKNPLTPVAMSVETMREAWARRRPEFGEVFEEATQAIREEVRRLARIVDEFGRFARLPPPSSRRCVSGAARRLPGPLPRGAAGDRPAARPAGVAPCGPRRPRPDPAGAPQPASERLRGQRDARRRPDPRPRGGG
jgi:HAMP domain-containing protein